MPFLPISIQHIIRERKKGLILYYINRSNSTYKERKGAEGCLGQNLLRSVLMKSYIKMQEEERRARLNEAQDKKKALERVMMYLAEQTGEFDVNWEDICYEADSQGDYDVIQLNELAEAPAKLDDTSGEGKLDVIEVDLGLGKVHKPTYVNAAREAGELQSLIQLLKQYRDCFAWDYSEMLGLDRSLVEHKIPLKPGYKPYK